MLMPRRRRFRKEHRGSLKGKASRCHTLVNGDFGLQALEPGWVTNRQLEAARIAITNFVRRAANLQIRVFPHKPVTKKPAESRMGGGKGDPETYVAVVKPGTILFEISGVSPQMAETALKRAAYKLPIKTKVIFREASVGVQES
ncbi:MAG: 50S ribosomal protein L16 [Armatimonadetes bacterium]|nr:50S ribosomal protein L16 [Armatimonadota bacterium]MDW8121166.1 50S ribosomal protein L16 [Armatimonadota bacterium]